MLLRILAARRLTEDFHRLDLAWPAALAEPLPGQFVMVRTRSGTDPLWRRPLGVHDFRRVRGAGVMSLLFQVVGPTTRDLSALGPGAMLDLLGPHGRGFRLDAAEQWLVAGGRGVAPLFFAARVLRRSGVACRVFLGGGGAGHILRERDLSRLGCRVEVATVDGSRGHRGLVTELVDRALPRLSERRRAGVQLAACGPHGMLKAVAAIAAARNVAAQVSVDPLMACGRGLCLGCSVPARGGYRLACQHGPVFDVGELDWGAP
jgi:dihydroorotate dehydrogenase electron transfer subunit